jgi:hypothetical protein
LLRARSRLLWTASLGGVVCSFSFSLLLRLCVVVCRESKMSGEKCQPQRIPGVNPLCTLSFSSPPLPSPSRRLLQSLKLAHSWFHVSIRRHLNRHPLPLLVLLNPPPHSLLLLLRLLLPATGGVVILPSLQPLRFHCPSFEYSFFLDTPSPFLPCRILYQGSASSYSHPSCQHHHG